MGLSRPGDSDDLAPILILGAGLSGLSAAYHLLQAFEKQARPGPKPEIWLVEAAAEPGGHARSHRREGFTFDITGHWLHLRDPKMQRLVPRLDPDLRWLKVQRHTEIYCGGNFIPYPFQHNLHALAPRERQRCVDGFLKAQAQGQAQAQAQGKPQGEPVQAQQRENFGEFVRRRFGEGMEELFFRPYNERLWDAPLESLTCDWMSRFLPVPEPEEILQGAVAPPDKPVGYNASFIYPQPGGIDHLPRAFVRQLGRSSRVKLHCNTPLLTLDPKGRRAQIGGEEAKWIPYSAVISTLALPELLGRIAGLDAGIAAIQGSLSWARWRYLDVALEAPPPRESQWIYVPERRFPFFRVGCPTRVCPANAPAGKATLYVELADRQGPLEREALVQSLLEVGMLRDAADVRFIQERRVEYAYVRFDHDYAHARSAILDHLSQLGVISCGRYGSWVYQSMEDSMIEGRDAASRLEAEGKW